MLIDNGIDGIWWRLRATRSSPPSATRSSEIRRQTYVSALEQSEQFFRAAANAGTATQPVQLFYGLSQAGRAIAAAASKLKSDDSWQLNGHGIQTVHSSLLGAFPEVAVYPDRPGRSGSFAKLSELLDSALWEKANAVQLHKLWDCIPENRHHPLTDDAQSRRTPIAVEDRNLYPDKHPLASVPVYHFPPWVIDSPNGKEALDAYLAAYPDAQQYHSFEWQNHNNPAPRFSRHQNGWGELHMHWQVSSGQSVGAKERQEYLGTVTRLYTAGKYFFPAVGTNSRSMHPLMAWWSVLYILSMLARYQPAEWDAHIDVDSSRHAVSIERLLSVAGTIVPELILETVEHVR